MFKFELIRQYTQVVSEIIFNQPKPGENPYLINYFSENSDFITDYPKLNFRLIDLKLAVIPYTKFPRTKLTPDLMKKLKSFKLRPYQSNMPVPQNRNVIYDITNYVSAVDLQFKPNSYRTREGTLIMDTLYNVFSNNKNYEKILIYSVDMSKPLPSFANRKIFPLLMKLKDGDLNFDHLLLAMIYNDHTKFRLLIKNRNYKIDKLATYLRNLKIDTSDINDQDVEKASDIILKKVDVNVSPENKEKVKDIVTTYLNNKPDSTGKIIDDNKIEKDEANKLVSKSILYRNSGDLKKSEKTIDKIVKKSEKVGLKANTDSILKAIEKTFADQLLVKSKPKITSNNVVVYSTNLSKAVDEKTPYHLFQKRQIDFEINLKNDINNSFKVLESKEVSIKTESILIVPKRKKPGELDKSDISVVRVVLVDSFGNKHLINIDIPEIDPNFGTFRLNGNRKCLINQIILCPISFPKKYEARFESSYSKFYVYSKILRREKYLQIFMGYKLPFLVFMGYSFGFDSVLKSYGITYTISDKKGDPDISCKINDSQYIIFEKVDTELKRQIVKSFVREKIYSFKVTKPFGTKEYFSDLILAMTGKTNSTYRIISNLDNIVDPVAKQVLINQQLPYEIENIIKYMSEKVILGIEDDRNDLTNQRIRGSEVIVHLIQKQVLAAYTVYREQILSGNKNAKFEISQTKVLSQFLNSEIVTNMEYANPIEEMATMTRVAPVGKNLGGIPDKQAIQTKARNVHPTYFGNIDPLDTPEGGSIGITQQLAMDALITNARGIFRQKEISNEDGSGILSTSSSMIPFIENDDGARVIMAVNQARQMLPLKNPKSPIVKSGYESILTSILSDNFVKKSPCNGKVDFVSDEVIRIICKEDGREHISALNPVHLKSGVGKDTLSVFKPIVEIGQNVKKGDIIAEGSCINSGEISLGRTLCVAFMPYKGYNFEDGIVLNRKLIENDSLTSLHGIEEEILVGVKDRIISLSEIGTFTKKGDPLIRKTIGELEELLGIEEDETFELSGQEMIMKSPGGKVVDIEIFSNIDDDKFPFIKDLIIKTRKRYGTKNQEKFTVRGTPIEGILIKFKLEQELKINKGDKLCNRHGNKGIVSLIEDDMNMPRTPWGDRIDVLLNPIGLIGRMNAGQLYELYAGLISKDLGIRILKAKDKNKIIDILKRTLPILDNSPKKQFSTTFLSNLEKLPKSEFDKFYNQVKENEFFPLIITPFKAPNHKQIIQVMKILGLKSGYNLYLPEFGVKTANEVPVGYMYISKLEHLGELKIHSRSTGPLKMKTGQPTAGKRQDGGQRLGEADTYSLISYNCINFLSEMLGPLSDDAGTKNEIISEIIQSGNADFKVPKTSPVRDLLNSYFIALMLERG